MFYAFMFMKKENNVSTLLAILSQVEDGAPSFQAMQSVGPFIKSVFADLGWEVC